MKIKSLTMELSEIQQKKKQLEDNITILLMEFEKETNTEISGIGKTKRNGIGMVTNEAGKDVGTVIRVEVEIYI